jgi:hypothetical protein
MDSACHQKCFIRERQRQISQTEEEEAVTVEAEIGVLWPKVNECWKPPEAGTKRNVALISPWFWPSATDLGFQASKTVKEYISALLNHQVHGNLL